MNIFLQKLISGNMTTPSYQDNVSIINFLKEFDCCSRCILRFLKVKIGTDIYINSEDYLKVRHLVVIQGFVIVKHSF